LGVGVRWFVRWLLVIVLGSGLLSALALLHRQQRAIPAGAHRLRGVVSRADTGAAVADVVVIVRDAAPPFAELHRASTDLDGRYDLAPLPDGDVHLHFVSPEFAELVFGPYRTSGGPTELTVDQVIAAESNRLRGRVVSSTSGLPIEGVEIRRAGPWLAPPAMSDRDGDFVLGGLPGGLQNLEFKRIGLPALVREVLIQEFRVTNETFSLEDRQIEVSGVVLEADGRPIADTEIVLSRIPGTGIEQSSFKTDSVGAFATRVPPGTWLASTGVRSLGALLAHDVTTVPPPTVLRAEPPAPDGCVVLTSDGHPAGGASVRWLSNGRMTFEGTVSGDGTTQRDDRGSAWHLLIGGVFGSTRATDERREPVRKPPRREFEAALNGETGRLTLSDVQKPCLLQLEPAVEVTVRSPSAEGLSWVRFPVGLGDRSEAIWFSGATRVSVPPGFQTFEFGSPLGLAHVKVELSTGSTAVVAPPATLFSRPSTQ
jgi:hypothetical protein